MEAWLLVLVNPHWPDDEAGVDVSAVLSDLSTDKSGASQEDLASSGG